MNKSNNLLTFFVILIMSFSSVGQVKVMSYNIRYANETDGANSWSQRKDYLTNQIRFYEPDILGVQEALLEQMEHLEQEIAFYDYTGVAREDGEKKGEFSAIFYNTEKFTKLESGTFWLSESPGEVSKGWDAAYPRICTYAKFRKNKSGEEFWVFNTHFDHIGEKARQESAKLIYKKMKELNKEGLPAILMGDFNLEPEALGIQFLKEKLTDAKDIADVVFGPVGTFNGFKFEEPVDRRIDYIFLQGEDIKVEKYAVLSDSKDLKYPSDHLPVLVVLKF